MEFILLPETSLSTRLKDAYHSLTALMRTRVQSLSTNVEAIKPRVAIGVVLLALVAATFTASVLALAVALSSLLIDEVKMSPAAAWGCTAAFLIGVSALSLLLLKRTVAPKEVAEEVLSANSAVRRAEGDFRRNAEALEQHLTNVVSEAQEKAQHTADEVRTTIHRLAPAQQVRRHPWGAMVAAALVGVFLVRR